MNSKEALKELEIATNWSSDEDIDKDLYNLWGNVACRTIKKDLDRLEELEEVIAVIKYIKEVLKEAFIIELREPIGNSASIYISKIKHNKAIVYISKEAYELLKDWLENE